MQRDEPTPFEMRQVSKAKAAPLKSPFNPKSKLSQVQQYYEDGIDRYKEQSDQLQQINEQLREYVRQQAGEQNNQVHSILQKFQDFDAYNSQKLRELDNIVFELRQNMAEILNLMQTVTLGNEDAPPNESQREEPHFTFREQHKPDRRDTMNLIKEKLGAPITSNAEVEVEDNL